jgi:hypothetical protein
MDDLPPNEVQLEMPAAEMAVSGMGMISGWSCLGGHLHVEVEDMDGNILRTIPLAHGTDRADTAGVCGDQLNGFSAPVNWNMLGSGKRMLRLIQNSEEVATREVRVVALGEEFGQDLQRIVAVREFPAKHQTVVLEWREMTQSFEIFAIHE